MLNFIFRVYYEGLIIDSHYSNKAAKAPSLTIYCIEKINFCLLFQFSYEQILYESY